MSHRSLVLALLVVLAIPAAAQPATVADAAIDVAAVTARAPDPADVGSIEDIVTAAYAAIQRAPGEDWDRFRSLFIPRATLIPNTEQTQGAFVVHSPETFIALVDSFTTVGGTNDRGFAEEGVHLEVRRYGDVAQAFSTYQKHFWGDDRILGRGINSFQLVYHGERWWIASIAWDEENGAGPIPTEYGGAE